MVMWPKPGGGLYCEFRVYIMSWDLGQFIWIVGRWESMKGLPTTPGICHAHGCGAER